ncbi:hypothetical protein HFE03_07980 [Paenibacillus sp. EKM102P]|uniref:hypothetical protein n=1 Tax=unclassified Paenibacillus TaxID=185978 RepID=UPI00142E07C5|nr:MULTISPECIES: hypothetical protein [unclassified Paenibacillus]KAF6620659.1 hypothetical protein HFE00_05880 [Paenibacillus sp. EKM101P]KAF6623886.1 hypothetical protein HFE03_07980 [Paenibacillus sp. EKM102P]KAF6634462.1 hypothetical protein HFE01_06535 [Paenibacillus sp. EKM10P]KAF6650392.1 hypothetical protein HFE02_01490 [Paenibacillus sp. EKM11P]
MNLYKIMFEHFSQKDSQNGILTYLAANSDSEVYEWLKSEPYSESWGNIFNNYNYKEKDNEVFDIYDNDFSIIDQESFRDRMIRLHGDMYDEEVELSDLYYGATLYGWNLVRENISFNDIKIMRDLGVNVEMGGI